MTDQEHTPLDTTDHHDFYLTQEGRYYCRTCNMPASAHKPAQAQSEQQTVDTTLDLAEGERLLAEKYKAIEAHVNGKPDTWDARVRAVATWVFWQNANGEALVTALKAATQQYQIACDLVEQTEAERDAARADLEGAHRVQGEMATDIRSLAHQLEDARDDLARVEAERNELQAQLERGDALFEGFQQGTDHEIERLQARIAELVTENQNLMNERQWFMDVDADIRRQSKENYDRIAELEGSLRGVYETHGRVDDGPCWCGDCERARSNLPAQTPSAS